MNYNLSHQNLIAKIAGENQAQALMERYGNLTALARADEHELTELPGVGAATAAAVKSALSLAAQLSVEVLPEAPLLDNPQSIADLLREEMRVQSVETLYVVLLNVRRRLIKAIKISQGTLDALLVHPREVFRAAIIYNAAALAVAHNHNSGNSSPSEADIRVTRDLIRAGQLLRIEVVDHVILGSRTLENPKDYASLRELGYFYS
jgi:DNA repair protein RadC